MTKTPPFETKEIIVKVIDSNDFDEFVNKIYGGDYEFVAHHRAENYSCYKFSIPNKNMPWPKDDADVRAGKYKERDTHRLFRILGEDGHLPKGEYLIEVSW